MLLATNAPGLFSHQSGRVIALGRTMLATLFLVAIFLDGSQPAQAPVFSDRIVIRPELDSVNLLEGGAIGIAGGRVRHQLDGTAALSSRGLGTRIGVTWRGRNTLESRIGGEVEKLRFSSLLLVNFKAFASAERLFGRNEVTRSMRVAFNVTNLFNERQHVRDPLGFTPLQYQAAYRDPIGRTVELELRKVF